MQDGSDLLVVGIDGKSVAEMSRDLVSQLPRLEDRQHCKGLFELAQVVAYLWTIERVPFQDGHPGSAAEANSALSNVSTASTVAENRAHSARNPVKVRRPSGVME